MRRQLEPTDDGTAAGDVEPEPEDVARAICLRLLTGAPRTRAELATAMRKKGVPPEVADRVLQRFADVNLVDDAAYAASFVESKHRERGLARPALKAELRRKGVDAETAQAAVELLDPADEEASARALVARRLRSMSNVEPDAAIRRLVGMLARKGYPGGLAYRVVREALADELSEARDLALRREDDGS
ncbi:MAG: regulatory protein [Frankiales bacterium]|nr:regulatory protein [Frankiales bacterium]